VQKTTASQGAAINDAESSFKKLEHAVLFARFLYHSFNHLDDFLQTSFARAEEAEDEDEMEDTGNELVDKWDNRVGSFFMESLQELPPITLEQFPNLKAFSEWTSEQTDETFA
jgi:hypothetical protein